MQRKVWAKEKNRAKFSAFDYFPLCKQEKNYEPFDPI